MDNLLERLEKMVHISQYINDKMKIYIKALQEISQADDQANPIALRNKARIALIHEPTTANKFNKDIAHGPNDHGDKHVDKVKRTELDKWKRDRLVKFGGDTGTDADFLGPNDPGDEQQYVNRDLLDESSAELAKFDREMREDAEAAWRNTVLHPEHKSEYDEEE